MRVAERTGSGAGRVRPLRLLEQGLKGFLDDRLAVEGAEALAILDDLLDLGGGQALALEGLAGGLHAVWKTAQTFMEYLSGIATCTADIVAAARRGHPAASVVCTRKNFPGTKAAAMKAVLCAGASPHRLSLSETLLVFPEHRAFLAAETPAATVQRLRRQWPERALVVEVAGEDEAAIWAAAGADIVQLEKLPPEAVDRIHRRIPGTRIAAAGGINASNAENYARAGATILVTSAPYFAAPRDVAVTLIPSSSLSS